MPSRLKPYVTTFYDAVRHYLQSDDPVERRYLKTIWDNIDHAEAQLFQDCFALSVLGSDRPRTYCEFGAKDGKFLSNTHLLDTQYGWSGIVAEPARCWHDKLWQNRPDAMKDTRCVWQRTGATLDFIEAGDGEFSTLSAHAASDHHTERRATNSRHYQVETVSLAELLEAHGYGDGVDFLSIDTEGSEVEILENFDLSKRPVGVICVEHNMTKQESVLDDLITSQNYRRCLEPWSRWDAWYVHESLL